MALTSIMDYKHHTLTFVTTMSIKTIDYGLP